MLIFLLWKWVIHFKLAAKKKRRKKKEREGCQVGRCPVDSLKWYAATDHILVTVMSSTDSYSLFSWFVIIIWSMITIHFFFDKYLWSLINNERRGRCIDFCLINSQWWMTIWNQLCKIKKCVFFIISIIRAFDFGFETTDLYASSPSDNMVWALLFWLGSTI